MPGRFLGHIGGPLLQADHHNEAMRHRLRGEGIDGLADHLTPTLGAAFFFAAAGRRSKRWSFFRKNDKMEELLRSFFEKMMRDDEMMWDLDLI